MPTKPLSPCRRIGCQALVDGQYCTDHTEDTRLYDRRRGSAQSRGYDAQWSAIRLIALRRDSHLCVACTANDHVTLALDVDHIEPIRKRPDLRLVLSNLQSLCRACHVKKTKREQRD